MAVEGRLKVCGKCGTDRWLHERRGGKWKGWKCWTCTALRFKRLGKSPGGTLAGNARHRARKLGLLCTIRTADVVIPAVCPVLGIPLVAGPNGGWDGSPTLDRRDCSRGYEPDNIVVISMRANRIKNNATVAELRRVAEWMELSCPAPLPPPRPAATGRHGEGAAA